VTQPGPPADPGAPSCAAFRMMGWRPDVGLLGWTAASAVSQLVLFFWLSANRFLFSDGGPVGDPLRSLRFLRSNSLVSVATFAPIAVNA
jgi:hypothetical protein